MKSDIEIAMEADLLPIQQVAEKLDITMDDLDLYGKYKAKITDDLWDQIKDRPDGKLILVTAINPTPAGEGKTTTTVGLGQAMAKIGKKAIIALREPSLGPCFGLKGGAAGGGYAQVVPMDELNLHFTGDFHAITSANNLLAAMLDNHPAGECSSHRSKADCMETLRRYERPCSSKYHCWLGKKSRWCDARGSFYHHGSFRDHGDSLSGR